MRKYNDRILEFLARIPMPVVLLVLCYVTYGLLASRLGFYLDDWYIVLFQKSFGSGNFNLFFNQDRPLFAYVYDVFVPIFRDSALAWQLFAVFSHALAASCFWWLLIKIMPERKKLAAIAALFFAVYPGFRMHWFSVMYSQVFMLMAIYFLSFILMIQSLHAKRGRWLYWIGALICLVIGIVPQETFIGLEFIRPLILWVALTPLQPLVSKRIKHTLLIWLSYLAVFAAFVVYRLANSKAYSYQADLFGSLRAHPLDTLLQLLGEVFWSTVDSIFTAWINLVELLKRNLLSFASIAMLVLMVAGALAVWLILKKRADDETSHSTRNGVILLVSLLATVAAMSPFIVGGFKITLEFPNNRYLIALAPGASLFLAALLDGILRTNKQKLVLASALVGLAVGAQFISARSFMLTWKAQQDFFWQLAWRAPQIQPNTILLTEDLPFSQYFSGTSLTAPLNLTYASGNQSHQIPYLFLVFTQQSTALPDLSADQPVEYAFRSFEFSGSTSDMLVFHKPSDGCLRILSPEDSDMEFINSQRFAFWHSAIPLSNLGRIIVNPEKTTIPQAAYFGSENQNQWCYFFEKADLARQQQDWQTTIDLYDAAQIAGFSPLMDSEWLPLLEAYLNTGQYDKASQITQQISVNEADNTANFCRLWTDAQVDQNVLPFAEENLSWLNCRE